MNLLTYVGVRFTWGATALTLGILAFTGSLTEAVGGGFSGTNPVQDSGKWGLFHHKQRAKSYGTLGYGGPGVYPGFQGFGLKYHPGYGYGGEGLGVGAFGGFPLYGGPGYPHAEPALRRCGGIVPFPYYGGPGFPCPGHPNYFGGVGPLSVDQPFISFESDPGNPLHAGEYGSFTGTPAYGSFTGAPGR